VSGSWSSHLVYWISSVIGGILAALVYDNFLMEKRQAV
jgi:glycerol uptake facilitator-like aquaporin